MIINYYYYHHCHPLFVQGSNREVRGWERKKIKEKKKVSHWEEALVAIVETQCCWKLGDIELQPSLCSSFPSMLQQPGAGGAVLGTVVLTGRLLGCSPAGGKSGLWL